MIKEQIAFERTSDKLYIIANETPQLNLVDSGPDLGLCLSGTEYRSWWMGCKDDLTIVSKVF